MEARYNIYFAGQLRKGHDLAGVRDRMASLFNADEPTLDKLFSGRNQLVKRNCDKATALKYKQAIESAGAVPVIRAVASEPERSAAPETEAPMTAAERIAALAAAPDLRSHQRSTTADASVTPRQPEQTPAGIQLAPAGTAVLRPEERPAPATGVVRAPDLGLDASGERLSDPPPPAPPPPDTSHLSEGAVGELLPNLPSSTTPLAPDTSAIELSPDGTDLSDCAAPEAANPDLDLSAIDLAPAGADVLEAKYRKPLEASVPRTDHLALED